MITRRHCLATGLGLSGLRAIASDSWISKDPGQWSEKDIQRLMTHSPWAKEVTVQFTGAPSSGGGMPSGGGRRGRGGGGPANMDGNPMNGGPDMGGAPERQSLPEMRTIVRWESSKAIRDARKKTVHPDDAPFYIVSVGPLPRDGHGGARAASFPEDQRKALEQRLKEVTQLQRKGHDPIGPDRTAVLEGPSARILVFYFPRDPHTIQLDDKEVTFYTALGPMEVRARFPLKEMMYRSQLEL